MFIVNDTSIKHWDKDVKNKVVEANKIFDIKKLKSDCGEIRHQSVFVEEMIKFGWGS
jgi:hypothetical protein